MAKKKKKKRNKDKPHSYVSTPNKGGGTAAPKPGSGKPDTPNTSSDGKED